MNHRHVSGGVRDPNSRQTSRPLVSEVSPSELNSQRSRAHELLKTPTRQIAHDASRSSSQPLQSAVHPFNRDNGSKSSHLESRLYAVDSVQRNLRPQLGQSAPPQSMPSSTHHAIAKPSQEYRGLPSRASSPRLSTSADPSTSVAKVPTPPSSVAFSSSLPKFRVSRPPASWQQPFISSDPSHVHRQSGLSRPTNLRAPSTASLDSLPAPPSHHRPSSLPGTVSNVSNTSSAYLDERLRLKKEPKSAHQPDLICRPTMPPFFPYLSPGSQSNGWDLFDMDGSQLPDEISSDPSEEIHRLFQNMPEIEIPPEDRAKTPSQMSCKLMEHQKVALKWLKDQEKNTDKRGGLLADTMGLGKTIEALALIVAHRPPQSGPKTTLVVAPLALLKQWNREIADKVKPAHRLTTFLYHGRDKRTKKAERLYSYDIVITTYETIAHEYKRVEPDGARKSPLFTDPKGFYRIVLDEAHKIKNRNAWCSKAVAELRAQFRLCMTGTLFMNNTAEIFSLVRFLQIAPYNDWSHFSRHIETPLRSWETDGKAVAMQRLQVLFRSITLRRTKDSVLDGLPILRLPKLTITSTSVELDSEQRAFYIAIEHNHQKLVNKYLKRSKLNKVITFILVLLTRLRQTCDHPYLIKSHKIPEEAKLNAKQMVQLAMRLDARVLERLKSIDEFQCPICDEPVERPMIIYPCGHDICPDCFSTMMRFGIEASRNSEQSQAGLTGIVGLADDMETMCPYEGCETKILANKVLCHDFFLDAHSLGGASQIEEEDTREEESDDCCSSDEEDGEDSEDDGGVLEDFIVSDDHEDSDIDDDDSDVDGADCHGGRSYVYHTPAPDGDDGEELGNSAEEINNRQGNEEDGDGMVDNQEPKSCLNRSPIPSLSVGVDDRSGQSQADQSSLHSREGSAPPSEISSPELGDDIWGRVLTRHRRGEHSKQDVDSDSDLESLSGLVTKCKSKQATPATGPSKQASAKRKRGVDSKRVGISSKRAKLGENSEPRRKRKSGKSGKKKNKNKKGKGKSLAELKKIGSTSKAAKAKYFDRLRRDWESSAKVDVTLDLLRKIRAEKPNEKTLVFSLWTSFLDLLEVPLQDERFRYLRYDGAMTFNERDDNVKKFSEDRNENILLVSLMAGNAGLNLTAASQVIILEPFWNPFVEDQAIDRTHRIGQVKAVEVHRLLVPDSVEDRILALQEKKRKLVSTALSEEGAQGAGRLTIGELRGLFGLR